MSHNPQYLLGTASTFLIAVFNLKPFELWGTVLAVEMNVSPGARILEKTKQRKVSDFVSFAPDGPIVVRFEFHLNATEIWFEYGEFLEA